MSFIFNAALLVPWHNFHNSINSNNMGAIASWAIKSSFLHSEERKLPNHLFKSSFTTTRKRSCIKLQPLKSPKWNVAQNTATCSFSLGLAPPLVGLQHVHLPLDLPLLWPSTLRDPLLSYTRNGAVNLKRKHLSWYLTSCLSGILFHANPYVSYMIIALKRLRNWSRDFNTVIKIQGNTRNNAAPLEKCQDSILAWTTGNLIHDIVVFFAFQEVYFFILLKMRTCHLTGLNIASPSGYFAYGTCSPIIIFS